MIFISEFSPRPGIFETLKAQSKRQVRAAGKIRVHLFGLVGNASARKATRPVATGTFAFPAFGPN
jgi:hypothetical protein